MKKIFEGWTIVFDLDGTLVETAPDLLGALNHVLAHEGRRAMQLSEIRGMIGHGAKAMIRAGFEASGDPALESEMERLWGAFIAHYAANITRESHLFPHCLDALDELISLGASLAICTNKTQALSDQVIVELGVADRFKVIVGADSVPDKKPHGDHILLTVNAAGGIPAKAVMIGDSETDEKAAQNAGLPFIFVPFGYASGDVSAINSYAVAETYADLVAILRSVVC